MGSARVRAGSAVDRRRAGACRHVHGVEPHGLRDIRLRQPAAGDPRREREPGLRHDPVQRRGHDLAGVGAPDDHRPGRHRRDDGAGLRRRACRRARRQRLPARRSNGFAIDAQRGLFDHPAGSRSTGSREVRAPGSASRAPTGRRSTNNYIGTNLAGTSADWKPVRHLARGRHERRVAGIVDSDATSSPGTSCGVFVDGGSGNLFPATRSARTLPATPRSQPVRHPDLRLVGQHHRGTEGAEGNVISGNGGGHRPERHELLGASPRRGRDQPDQRQHIGTLADGVTPLGNAAASASTSPARRARPRTRSPRTSSRTTASGASASRPGRR